MKSFILLVVVLAVAMSDIHMITQEDTRTGMKIDLARKMFSLIWCFPSSWFCAGVLNLAQLQLECWTRGCSHIFQVAIVSQG